MSNTNKFVNIIKSNSLITKTFNSYKKNKILNNRKNILIVIISSIFLLSSVLTFSLFNGWHSNSSVNAAPVCDVISGFSYNASSGYCEQTVSKVAQSIFVCPNGSLPDVNNNCNGLNQNILFNCDQNIPNQQYLLSGDVGGVGFGNLCTTAELFSQFTFKVCQYSYNVFDAASGNSDNRADRFNQALNYNGNYYNGNPNSAFPSGDSPQSASGPNFCVNGSGCPITQRAIFAEATERYGTNNQSYPAAQLLCVNISLLGATSNASPLYTIAGGRSGSQSVGNRNCNDPFYGSPDTTTIMGDQNGVHQEAVWLCARNVFQAYNTASIPVCPVIPNYVVTDQGANCLAYANPTSYTPEGVFETVDNNGRAIGWAIDPDDRASSIDIHFYIDGPSGSGGAYAGMVSTTILREDINTAYSTTGNHGFSFQIPSEYCTSTDRTIYAYGIDLQGIDNPLLDQSPRTFNLTPQQCGVPTTISTTNISNSTNCTQSLSVNIPATYNCTFPLTGDSNNNYVLPSSPVNAWTATDGSSTTPLAASQSDACVITGNNTPQAALQCNNIKTSGATPGVKNVLITINSTNPTDRGDVTLVALPTTITGDNISSGTCTPASVTVGTTTTCNFPLTGDPNNNYVLPNGGITANTPAGASSACVITNNGTPQVALSCPDTPAGNTPGSVTVTPTGNGISNPGTATITVSALPPTTITTNNIGNSTNCTQSLSVNIPATYNCTFPLTGSSTNNYAMPGSPINAWTATDGSSTTPLAASQSDACVITGNGTPQAALQCNNIKTSGATPGVKNVLITINSTNPTDRGDVNLLIPPLTSQDIPGITFVCNDNNPVTVNSTTTCTFTLPDNRTLPSDFKMGIGDSTPAGTCTLSTTTRLVTCINVPTGSQTGNQSIYAQIGNQTKVDTGEKILVNGIATVRTGGEGYLLIVFSVFLGMIVGYVLIQSRKKISIRA
jgi:hypothetical protein